MSKKAVAVKAVVSILFFLWLFYKVQWGAFAECFTQINWFYFGLSFFLVVLMMPSSCLKWKVLLDQNEPKLPYLSLLRIYLVGYFFSNLLPSNVGGDVVRSYYAGRRIGSQGNAAVATFIERFSGVILLLMLAILAPLMKPSLYRLPHVYLPACLALFLLLFVVWMWKVREPLKLPDKIARGTFAVMRRVNTVLRLGVCNKVVDSLEKFYSKVFKHVESFHRKLVAGVKYLHANPRPLWAMIGLTVYFYFMTWVNVYVSFKAFNVHPDFVMMSAIVPSAMIVGMIPVTLLGNLGFTESIYVVFFGSIGISQAGALAMGLLLRLKLLVVGVIGFLFYLTYRHDRHDFEKIVEAAGEENLAVATDEQA